MRQSRASLPKTGLNILITGATAGIGRHLALDLAARGHRVFAAGRRVDALEALAQVPNVEALPLDVTCAASIDTARAEVDRRTEGHGLDVLINNAGYGLIGPVEQLGDTELRRQFDTNVFGLLAVTRAFLPAMRARGRGRVINIGSIGGRVTFPFMGAYNATKYAVESLSDALRAELAPFGVRVVLIEPGIIRSEFGEVAMRELVRDADSPYAPFLERADELHRLTDRLAVGPEHVARVVRRAIGARWPAARYIAPRRTYSLLLLKLLPTFVLDRIVRGLTGLTRKRLPVASMR